MRVFSKRHKIPKVKNSNALWNAVVELSDIRTELGQVLLEAVDLNMLR